MFGSPKRSALLSWLLHGGAILLILAMTRVQPQLISHLRDVLLVPSDIAAYRTRVHSGSGGGGGGGGAHAETPASRGERPRFALEQVSLARAAPNPTPILPWEPTLIGNPDDRSPDFNAARYGLPNGVLGPLSDGTGTGGGQGNGHGTGDGPGDGPGFGPGHGGDEGGGGVDFLGAGGNLTKPELVWKVDPDYSEDARRARLQGTVLLRIEVDTKGQAQNISVRQGLGLGLDDRAMEAVKKWKFTPGKVNGKPTAVVAYVEVNFRLL